MKKWFYQENGLVKGPLQSEELKTIIKASSNTAQIFIWSRGYSDWKKADRWQPDQEENSAVTSTNTMNLNTSFRSETAGLSKSSTTSQLKTPDNIYNPHPVLAADIISNIETSATEKFRVQLNFEDQPTMTKEELMAFTMRQADPALISVFDQKSKEWKDIYFYRDIAEKLGLTRRKHPRVPILAQFVGKKTTGEDFNARLVTISEGGFGLTDIYDLNLGEQISGLVSSPHFYTPLAITGEVTYAGPDGYVGLKFIVLNDEAQSLVTDYLRRFKTTSNS